MLLPLNKTIVHLRHYIQSKVCIPMIYFLFEEQQIALATESFLERRDYILKALLPT